VHLEPIPIRQKAKVAADFGKCVFAKGDALHAFLPWVYIGKALAHGIDYRANLGIAVVWEVPAP
jgi:hypothetical protein